MPSSEGTMEERRLDPSSQLKGEWRASRGGPTVECQLRHSNQNVLSGLELTGGQRSISGQWEHVTDQDSVESDILSDQRLILFYQVKLFIIMASSSSTTSKRSLAGSSSSESPTKRRHLLARSVG